MLRVESLGIRPFLCPVSPPPHPFPSVWEGGDMLFGESA